MAGLGQITKQLSARGITTPEEFLEYMGREVLVLLRALRDRVNALSGTVETYTTPGTLVLPVTVRTALVNAAAGPITLTLPLTEEVSRAITVKKIDASGNAVTALPQGTSKIDGASSWSTTTQYDKVTVESDDANFWSI